MKASHPFYFHSRFPTRIRNFVRPPFALYPKTSHISKSCKFKPRQYPNVSRWIQLSGPEGATNRERWNHFPRAFAGTAVALSDFQRFEAALTRIRVFVKHIVLTMPALRIASSLKASGSRNPRTQRRHDEPLGCCCFVTPTNFLRLRTNDRRSRSTR